MTKETIFKGNLKSKEFKLIAIALFSINESSKVLYLPKVVTYRIKIKGN